MNQFTQSKIIKFLVYLGTSITFFALFAVIIDVLVKGIPNLKPSLFAWNYTTDNVSMMPAIVNTFIMVGLSLLIALPLGIVSAIYLNEYASSKSLMRKPVALSTQTLAGIPSIVYGLFGSIFFVTTLKWGFSLLAGAFTLAIMILPTVMTSTEEALKSVPRSLREASYGLGAMKFRTVFNVVLPPAMPGILSGVVLAIGRIVGETAALIHTSGSATRIPRNVMGSGRTLAVHMYVLSNEGLHRNEAYATGVILLILVFLLNWASTKLAGRIERGGNDG